MSNPATIDIPNVDESLGTLDGLYAQAFFSKLAEYGIEPQSEEAAMAMLKTAAYLDMVESHPAVKQASVDPFVDAASRLEHVLADSGLLGGQPSAQQQLVGVKQAAYALAQDPDLYRSVLSVKAAEAAQGAST